VVPDFLQDHVSSEWIEKYVSGELADPDLIAGEEHLLICESCRDGVAEMDVFIALPGSGPGAVAAFVHATADGPVTLEIRVLPESPQWSARFSGSHLEGQAVLASFREACAWLRRSFAEMFPEHLCTGGCGPAD
jgi:anti-sigma factor RsiW